jgi:hypothetical protein
MLGRLFRRAAGLDVAAQWQRHIRRDITALVVVVADGSISVKVDNETLRIPIFRKHGSGPLIAPSGKSWMAGAVYDGRPIEFHGRKLFYFCAQPVYRTDMLLVVGGAELVDDKIKIFPSPVLVPDIETFGIDIPAFTVFENQIVGLYVDGHGPGERDRGANSDVVVVRSSDGRSFSKKIIKNPLSEFGRMFAVDRIGLPWLLNDGGSLRVYMRGKSGPRNFLASSVLDLDNSTLGPMQILCDFPRNPINISVTKRSCGYLLFYGCTTGGGFYFAVSNDGLNWDLSQEMMMTSSDDEWGWDYTKVCASPDNSHDDHVSMCYVSNQNGPCIGYGNFDVKGLLRRNT